MSPARIRVPAVLPLASHPNDPSSIRMPSDERLEGQTVGNNPHRGVTESGDREAVRELA